MSERLLTLEELDDIEAPCLEGHLAPPCEDYCDVHDCFGTDCQHQALAVAQDAKTAAWFVAQALVLVEALRGVEWLVAGSTFFCPGCLRTKGDGHDKDCKMHLALTSPLALLVHPVHGMEQEARDAKP